MKYKILSLILALVLSLGITAAAEAPNRVIDDAEAFGSSIEELNRMTEELYNRYGLNFCVFISEDSGGTSVSEYADALYGELFGDQPGIAFVDGIREKRMAMRFFGGAEVLFTNELVDRMYEAYREPEYYSDSVKALLTEADAVLAEIAAQFETEEVPRTTAMEAETVQAVETVPWTEIPDLMETLPDTIPTHRLLPRLVDGGDLLTDQEEAALAGKLDSISTILEFDVVIVTAPTLGDRTPTQYADDFFDYNGYGWGEDSDGILLLVCMEHRDYAVSTCGFGEKAFLLAGLEMMEPGYLPQLSDGEYYECFSAFADLCQDYVQQARSGHPYGWKSGLGKKLCSGGLIIGLGTLFAFAMTVSRKRKLKSVVQKAGVIDYVRPGSMDLQICEDHFVRTYETRRPVPASRSTSSSGGSSGNDSGSHVSSSGRSHGGTSGKF